MGRRGAAVAGLVIGGAAAALVRERTNPSACPYSQRWMLHFPRPWLSVDRLIQVLEPRAGERLLEVGPGTGVQTLPVARALEPGGTLDAFDVQQEMLDDVARQAESAGVSNLRATLGDGRQLPYGDESFDGAFLVTVLGEIPDQDAALRELRRVVRPGGRVVFGEIPLLDPHFVSASTLARRASAAGLRFDRRLGPALGFYARFSVP